MEESLQIEKLELRTKERAKARNTIIMYFCFLPVQFVISIIVLFTMHIDVSELEKITPESITANIMINFLSYIYILVSVVAASIYFLKVDAIKLKEEYKKVLIWFLIGAALAFSTSIILGYLQQLAGVNIDSKNEELINSMIKNGGYLNVLNFIPIVIIAPLCEELVFRKAIFTLIDNNKKSRTITAFLTSMLSFALMHLITEIFSITSYSLLQIIFIFAPYLLMSFILTFVYHKTRNIYTTISIHFLNNLISFILLMVQ